MRWVQHIDGDNNYVYADEFGALGHHVYAIYGARQDRFNYFVDNVLITKEEFLHLYDVYDSYRHFQHSTDRWGKHMEDHMRHELEKYLN